MEIIERGVVTAERIIISLPEFGRLKPPTRRKVDINDVAREIFRRKPSVKESFGEESFGEESFGLTATM